MAVGLARATAGLEVKIFSAVFNNGFLAA